MSDLKQSILTLFLFVVTLLGIANVESFQESIIDFSPVFFVLIALILFSELIVVGWLVKAGVRISQYFVTLFWLSIYGIVWYFYLAAEKSIEVNLVQLLLVLLTAVLAFDVGRRIDQTDITLERLASSAYPNRSMEIENAQNQILSEIARSRRYHHPLSVLAVKLEKNDWKEGIKEMNLIAEEMMNRFAIAKVSQILSDYARNTDLVLRDRDGMFILICPETNLSDTMTLSKRIKEEVKKDMNSQLLCGGAAFPDEALTFEDLVDIARKRIQ